MTADYSARINATGSFPGLLDCAPYVLRGARPLLLRDCGIVDDLRLGEAVDNGDAGRLVSEFRVTPSNRQRCLKNQQMDDST